jgi:hypothetical protein
MDIVKKHAVQFVAFRKWDWSPSIDGKCGREWSSKFGFSLDCDTTKIASVKLISLVRDLRQIDIFHKRRVPGEITLRPALFVTVFEKQLKDKWEEVVTSAKANH